MPKVSFAYDALGRRIETVDAIAGITKRYYYDDQRVAVIFIRLVLINQ